MGSDYEENLLKYANGAQKQVRRVLDQLTYRLPGKEQRIYIKSEGELNGIYAEIVATLKKVHFEVHEKLGLVYN
jgi:hypothetical protein